MWPRLIFLIMWIRCRAMPSVVAVLLLLAVATTTVVRDVEAATAKRPKVTKHQRHVHFRDHVLEQLPDLSLPSVQTALRCSACTELSRQLFETLLDMYQQRDPKHSELVRAIDDMCDHHVNMYGLVINASTGNATTTFSRDDTVERVQGAWVHRFMKERCAHLMVNHEETILEKHPEADHLEHFQTMMCVEWDRSCKTIAVDGPNYGGNSGQVKTATPRKPLSKGSYSRSLSNAEEL